MKPGQLIEYNLSNIFQENSYTTCGGETIPQPFSEKPNFKNISRSSFINFVFFAYQAEGYRNRLKLSWRLLTFTSCKIKKNKQKEVRK